MAKNYDIFISYRRIGAGEMAYIIYQYLEKAGYKVYIDLEKLVHGKFNVQLLDTISNCKAFVLVLPPDGLERCKNEDDWVRREIEHALHCNKTIIPVMLRDFSWPANLPESMKNVATYQGVQVKDLISIPSCLQKLEKYLSFVPRKSSAMRKMMPAIAVSGILTLACIGGALWYQYQQDKQDRQELAEKKKQKLLQACTGEASALTIPLAIVHGTMDISEDLLTHWQELVKNYNNTDNEREKQRLIDEFRKFLAHKESLFEKIKKEFQVRQLHADTRATLVDANINVPELELLYSTAFPQAFRDFDEIIKSYKQFLNPQYICSDSSIKLFEAKHQAYIHGVNTLYYGYLSILNDMPQEAIKDHWKLVGISPRFPKESPSLSDKDLESFIQREMNAAEKCIQQVAVNMAKLEGELTAQNNSNKPIQINTPNELHLTNKANELVDLMLNSDKSIIKSYEDNKPQLTILPNEPPEKMWGKLLIIAGLADFRQSNHNKWNEKYLKLTKTYNLDKSLLKKLNYETPADKLFDVLQATLDDCEKHIGDEWRKQIRFDIVRKYYKDVQHKKIPFCGVLIFEFPDKEHPLFRLGDIITHMNGNPINTAEDYKTFKNQPGVNKVRILRYDADGKGNVIETELPDTPILTGFIQLKLTTASNPSK